MSGRPKDDTPRDITQAMLRCARPENLERLARSLKLDMPPRPPRGIALERWMFAMAREVEDAIDVLHLIEQHGGMPIDRATAIANG